MKLFIVSNHQWADRIAKTHTIEHVNHGIHIALEECPIYKTKRSQSVNLLTQTLRFHHPFLSECYLSLDREGSFQGHYLQAPVMLLCDFSSSPG
jgi:hypothetical protein